jgi:predicted  nucleic acid-binding Zn-ribbon protein
MNHSLLKISLIAIVFLSVSVKSNSQAIPEEYRNQSIPEQLNFTEEHTRVYENFRAVREDIFQLLTKNINDSLARSKKTINSLITEKNRLNNRIDSINQSLASTNNNLESMTRTKNSIRILGIEIHKATYNTIMWTILGILVALLVIGYLTFKQNRTATLKTKKELTDLLKEFEDYKQKTRIEKERTTMEHFNEIKKLKASMPGSRGQL